MRGRKAFQCKTDAVSLHLQQRGKGEATKGRKQEYQRGISTSKVVFSVFAVAVLCFVEEFTFAYYSFVVVSPV